MAYQAKRKKLYTEEFQLVDENDTIVHTLHVALDPDGIARKLSEKHMALVNAIQAVSKVDMQTKPSEALEAVGNTATDLLEAVFGTDDARTIIEFYDGRYMEMCIEVIPFVINTVIPTVRRMAQDNKKAIASGYSRRALRRM